jgi:hypothetical protein
MWFISRFFADDTAEAEAIQPRLKVFDDLLGEFIWLR